MSQRTVAKKFLCDFVNILLVGTDMRSAAGRLNAAGAGSVVRSKRNEGIRQSGNHARNDSA